VFFFPLLYSCTYILALKHTYTYTHREEEEEEKEDVCEVVYNVKSLCEYLISTGRFVEPTSRRVIEKEDVEVCVCVCIYMYVCVCIDRVSGIVANVYPFFLLSWIVD
jgi:hypothetical protein